jgi:predicted nucleic acid-binding protein
VISELRKPSCDTQVRAWSDSQHPTSLFLSRVTIAEIRYGIERLAAVDPSRKRLEPHPPVPVRVPPALDR